MIIVVDLLGVRVHSLCINNNNNSKIQSNNDNVDNNPKTLASSAIDNRNRNKMLKNSLNLIGGTLNHRSRNPI